MARHAANTSFIVLNNNVERPDQMHVFALCAVVVY